MAAEPKSESTYWQFTLNVISRELGVGNVYVCACWGCWGEGVRGPGEEGRKGRSCMISTVNYILSPYPLILVSVVKLF